MLPGIPEALNAPNLKTMCELFVRLLRDDRGQDILEYALLTASVGLMGIATWPLIASAIGQTYQEFDADTQDLWEVPDPGAGG